METKFKPVLPDNAILAIACALCGAHYHPHSPACPNGERYKAVQRLGASGIPLNDPWTFD